MSRSRKKRPYSSVYCYNSEKEWKRGYNRRMRRITRQLVYKWGHDEDLLLPTKDEIGDVWLSPSEGKSWFLGWLGDFYDELEFFRRILRK